jgi:hypothetical protein
MITRGVRQFEADAARGLPAVIDIATPPNPIGVQTVANTGLHELMHLHEKPSVMSSESFRAGQLCKTKQPTTRK